MEKYTDINIENLFDGVDTQIKYAVIYQEDYLEDWYNEDYIFNEKPKRETKTATQVDFFKNIENANERFREIKKMNHYKNPCIVYKDCPEKNYKN